MKLNLYALIVLIFLCNIGKNYARENKKLLIKSDSKRNLDSTLLISNLKSGEKAMFFYIDNMGNTIAPFEMSSNGSKKILISEPILLINSFDQTPYLIYPNETLWVSKNKASTVLTVKNNALRTRELAFFLNLIKEQRYLFGAAQLASKEISRNKVLLTAKFDLNRSEDEALKQYKLRLKYLDSNKQLLSAQHYNYVKTLFKYFYLGDRLFVTNIPSVKFDQLPQNYLKEMAALANEFKFDEYLGNLGYQIALHQYAYFLDKLNNIGPALTDKYAFINKSFNGNTKRFLLFSLLKNPVVKNNSDYQAQLDKFIKEGSDSYSKYLLENDFRKVDKNYELMDPEGKLISWTQILQKHKGNTIYVDFWASWCIPCRKMMPFSRELKKNLAGHKISMLYISSDKSVSEWKTASKQENLDKAESYIVTDQKSNLLKLFKIAGIPRYMIIDKNGNIIDENSIKPDDKDLLKKLIAIQEGK